MVSMSREDLVVIMEAGYIYLGMSRFKEAREVFEGAGVLVPDSEVPIVALGNVYFCEKKFDIAIRTYQIALQKKNGSAFARAHLGEALFFKGKKPEAIAELSTAIGLDPSGKSGNFAKTLKEAIEQGFDPMHVKK